jgi:O-acetyl-ADP-ribose deacetylase (regulator of RNase III)
VDAMPVTDLNVLKKISIWKGNITTLKVDCIVNAANSALLGCFQPNHQCIDNAIHWQAGPRLRKDCEKIMELQGDIPEPEGESKITRAYNLPSKYVLHTVGPQLSKGATPTSSESKALQSCYVKCLDIANEISNIRSIAFPCISTGLFGYP